MFVLIQDSRHPRVLSLLLLLHFLLPVLLVQISSTYDDDDDDDSGDDGNGKHEGSGYYHSLCVFGVALGFAAPPIAVALSSQECCRCCH